MANILVDSTTGTPLVKGQRVTDFRGEHAYYSGGRPPEHSASTGRIYVARTKRDAMTARNTQSFFPSVFGAEWRSQ
jgi:hypothetical protein